MTPEWIEEQLAICDAADLPYTATDKRGDLGPMAEFINAASVGYPKALREIQRLRELLAKFEWVVGYGVGVCGDTAIPCMTCPFCRHHKEAGHAGDCELGAAL